jgi:CDP-diacylglycerol---serine O-phosphatidyltransferase
MMSNATNNERRERRHFSMIRNFHLADFFTISNGFCGVWAIFEAMKYLRSGDARHVYLAALLIPLALFFDVLDGRIARWRHNSSSLGRELDSLADAVSFGVAPAAIAFAVGLNSVLDQMILIYFAACGISRLARYNVTAVEMAEETGKVEYFEGTPIPTSVFVVALLMLAFYYGNFLPVNLAGARLDLVALLFFISGSLMISKTLRIPKP